MDWTPIIDAISAGFPDERVHEAFREFVEGTGGQIEYDGEIVHFSKEMVVFVEQKALVIDVSHRSGGFLTARVVLDPILDGGSYQGLSHGGTIRFRISFDGEYLDEVYSRAGVLPR